MAQRITHVVTCDLTGQPADETVELSLDGIDYIIDLTVEHATALRNALSDYIDAARRVPKSRSTVTTLPTRGHGTTTLDRTQAQAMRDWARRNDYSVSARGRIPAKIAEAYHARAVASAS